MKYGDSIKWLENLKNDIGQGDQRLWHYEQALSEIIDLLQSTKDKIEDRTLVELPNGWIDALKLLTCAASCYADIKHCITEQMRYSKDIAELFFKCPTVQGSINDWALSDLADAKINFNEIQGFDEILKAMPHFEAVVRVLNNKESKE